tara:strand:+ start:203 stop:466 length:264 start_codon:yes stop_codon:yes gene_type:complete
MQALKTSKGARKGGTTATKPNSRHHKKKGLVNVKQYLPWMKRVCSYKLVFDQLDNLEYDLFNNSQCDQKEVQKRIAQIKKDVSNIKR